MESRQLYTQLKRERIEKSTTLREYLEGLVTEYGDYQDGWYQLSYNDLSLEQKLKLIGLFEESNDSKKYGYDVSELYYPEDLHELCLGGPEKKITFVEKVIKNLTSTYEDVLQEIIDEYASELTHFVNGESGLKLYQYADNGELEWTR